MNSRASQLTRLSRALFPAALLALFVATTAQAQIVWTYLPTPVVALANDFIAVDIGAAGSTGSTMLNNVAGNTDFVLTLDAFNVATWDVADSAQVMTFNPDGTDYVSRLDFGNSIPGLDARFRSSSGGGGSLIITDPDTYAVNSAWAIGQRGYLGLFIGNSYYAWAEISYDFDGDSTYSLTLYSFAYQNNTGLSIQAGAIPEPGVTPLLAALAAGSAALWRRRSLKNAAPAAA